jgi:hypothetical protein
MIGALTLRAFEGGCYVCRSNVTLQGVIQRELDFLARAKAKVDQMVERARQRLGRQ